MALLAWGALGCATLCQAADWLPLAPDELQMSSEPAAPKAPAIYLYRQVDRDDSNSSESVYVRIKILTEEGRKYADVEIPYDKIQESIRSIQARAIKPDGSIANFSGQIFDKTLVKTRGVRYFAKTFTIPDIQVGSILEYRFRRDMDVSYVFNSNWILSADLYTRHAKFSLRPNQDFSLQWSWPYGLPKDTVGPDEKHGVIQLETHNIPAFVAEEYMPPEDLLKFRVEFVYQSPGDDEKEPDAYWKRFDKERLRTINDFIDARRAMEEAVAQIVAPGDAPEARLRKIYERVQQVRNVSFERQKTEEEEKREHLHAISDVGEVWKRGYGSAEQITWLMLALARAAGFQADPVEVATRDVYFFDKKMMNGHQLNTNVVLVSLDGKDLYLDPGAAFTPFGMLPWNETAVQGLRFNKEGGTWVTTPLPPAAQSRIACSGSLQLSPSGALEGRLTVTFTGLEALTLRVDEHNEDAADRKLYLERVVEDLVPVGIEVHLANTPDWSSSAPSLVAEYDLKIPGWAQGAGRRLLAPSAPFTGSETHLFEHPDRLYPIYNHFPHEQYDDITVSLPPGFSATSLPKAENLDLKVLVYSRSASAQGKDLHLERRLEVASPIVSSKYYDQVRKFYQDVRTSDEQQIVLTPAAAPGKH
jgi:transglutaminase-like putative cysteine protease